MPLQNAYAVGPCQVQLSSYSLGVLWQGGLTPGNASPTFTGDAGETLQVVVNADGSTELDLVSGSVGGPYILSVVPSYSMSSASQIIIQSITLSGVSGNACASSTVGSTHGVILSGSGSAWTPDPCTVTSSGNKTGFAVYQGRVV